MMNGGNHPEFLEAQLLREQVEKFMEAQWVSQRQETAAAIKLRGDLSAALAVPVNCLLGRVPGILKVVDDHVLFPFSPNWPGRRWIRVSCFQSLERVCYRFREFLQGKTIVLHVMPYLSPMDAYKIHQMVSNPGRIVNPHDDENGDEGQNLPVEGRVGVLLLGNPNAPADEHDVVHLKFTVTNYGLLWAKASQYAHFIGTMAPAKTLNCNIDQYLLQVMEDPIIEDANLIPNLEEACEQSKRELILTLHKEGIDPHDTILAVDAVLHEQLYDMGYDPCYPNDHIDDEMKDRTKNAVNAYMIQLEHENVSHNVCSVARARWNVLMSEALYAAEAHRIESVQQIRNAMQACKEQCLDAIGKIDIAASRPSLIGVISPNERLM